MKNEKERKEYITLLIGFLLILLVIIVTLFRLKPSDKNSTSKTSEVSKTLKDEDSYDFQSISARDLQQKIIATSNNGMVVLDIRPFEAYISEHIIDSLNIPIEEFPVGDKIDPKNIVYVIGKNNDDGDIKKAVDELEKEGFQNIQVLAGGMEAWKQYVGITITYGDPKSFVDQTKVSYIDPEQLNDALNNQVPVFIVDVRSESEYAKGHINGSKNVPFDDLEKKRTQITESKVVVVGANELQEFQASVQMFDMLKVQPFVMRTAMDGWRAKGFEITQ